MITRNTIFTILIGSTLTLAACDKGGDKAADKTAQKAPDKKADEPKADAPKDGPGEPEPEAPALDPKVEKAVTVANKISASPSETDTILADAGLDRDSFDKLLYEIARDPELSKSYTIARES
jgi:hypothetical protein